MARSTSDSFFRTSPAFSRSRCRHLFAAIPRIARTAPNVVYQLLEKVTVLSRERIRVTLRDGLEIEQAVEQPKRRKFA